MMTSSFAGGGYEGESQLLASPMAALHLFGIDERVAAELRSKRTRIAGAILEHAIRRSECTVGAELLAQSFVDRFVQALTERQWDAFFAWIDRTCERYAELPSIARILTLGASILAAHVYDSAADVAGVSAGFRALGERIAHIAQRPRSVRSTSPKGTLDEIDAALNRLMLQLTNFDAATAEHSRAVSMWCARIGKKMALSPSETTFLMRAGLIHDIGKVTTPPQILNAPHRLSDPDMAIMRRHAHEGAAIVEEIPRLAHLTPTVRGHHERIDGRGYPDGRTGSEIPLTVRIVSVADCFNAMIGNRPYRAPMAPTAALEQLRIHSDTQFDRNVVSAMIEVVQPH